MQRGGPGICSNEGGVGLGQIYHGAAAGVVVQAGRCCRRLLTGVVVSKLSPLHQPCLHHHPCNTTMQSHPPLISTNYGPPPIPYSIWWQELGVRHVYDWGG